MSAKKVADALAGVLADTYVLLAKTQNYHWNVAGATFPSLHLLFEAQYEELFAAVDEVAERVRQLGFPAPGTLAEFLRLTVLSEQEAAGAAGMVADLASCHTKVSGRAHAAFKLADADGDDGTADLLVGRMKAHDKAAWMLKATLGSEPVGATEAPARSANDGAAGPVQAKGLKKASMDGKGKVKGTALAAKSGKKRSRQALG